MTSSSVLTFDSATQSIDSVTGVCDYAALALHSMGDAVIIADARRLITYVNPEATRLTGWTHNEALGQSLDSVLRFVSDKIADGMRLVRRDGSSVAISNSAAPLRGNDGEALGTVILMQDATRQRRMGRRLYYEATHDSLTGLPNRRELERRIAKVLRTRTREHHRHALLFLDLDRFKLVNDRFGHEKGDELLCRIGGLLRSQVRRGDLLARLGGDEFAAVLENCPPEKAIEVAQDFRTTLEGLHFIGAGPHFSLGASVGLLLLRQGGKVSDALRTADAACYRAKRAGGNRIEMVEMDYLTS